VEDADLALRKAIDLNPNHPMLEVIRYYEDEMLEDGQHWGKTLVEEDNEKVLFPLSCLQLPCVSEFYHTFCLHTFFFIDK
jgi:hypothetical protein